MKNKGNGKETSVQNANVQNRSDNDRNVTGKNGEREKEGLQRRNSDKMTEQDKLTWDCFKMHTEAPFNPS